ncbi:MAG TPA: alpha/beta hydrolase [Desulfobacterales bacterium]|nr:alpha/beta hydrolase [Desulfobacterales bacterium]
MIKLSDKKLFPACLILVSLCILSGCASWFIYHPDSAMRRTPADEGLSYESVDFETQDGVRLSGWWLPVCKQRGVVLFCHGNAGNVSHRLDSLLIFNRLRLSTFIFDYRGYGKSGGRPSERGTYLDSKAAWNFLVQKRKIPPGDIIVFGRSLGGSIAAWLAQEHSPRMLIVESCFTSLQDIARDRFRWFPASLLGDYRYDTRQYLERTRCPVLIIHSRNDDLIPFRHGLALYETANGPKRFLEISGSHNRGFIDSLKQYEAALDRFISDY